MNLGQERIAWIDLLKVYAIFLVVIGHIIQSIYQPANFDDVFLFRLIYSFHMPLFFFISGYLSYKKKVDFKWLKKRFVSYMIPFVTWTFILFFITDRHKNSDLIQYIFLVIKYPDNSYWFLWTLFQCNLLFFIDEQILRFFEKEKSLVFRLVIYIFSLMLIRVSDKMLSGLFGLSLLFKHLFFFYLGYMHRYIYEICEKYRAFHTNQNVKLMIFVLFGFLVCFYRRIGYPSFYYELKAILNNDVMLKVIVNLYPYVLACLGIWASVLMIKYLHKLLRRDNYRIAAYTMMIYLIHFELLRSYTNNQFLDAVLSFILSISVPIGIYTLVSRNKYLTLLLFGQMEKREV